MSGALAAVAVAHGASTETFQRVGVIAIAVLVFALVVELVRRRRLMERYALLWMFASATLLLLALWKGLLLRVSSSVGIYYAPSALFVIAFGFVLLLLLHFSLVISKLSDQNKVLAQKIGMMEERLSRLSEGEREAEPDAEPSYRR